MANQLSKSGIISGSIIRPWHVTQSIDAFTGTDAYDITVSGSLIITGSTNITGSITADGFSGSFSGSFQGDGTNITGVTAEWDGSHVGNASITGSLEVTIDVSASAFSGSGVDIIGVISSSYATTSSYVENAQTSSYVENAQTASYVTTAQTASYVTLSQTASYVENAQTASFTTGSNVYGPFGSNSIISASHALTASFSEQITTPSGPGGPIGPGGNGGGNNFGLITLSTESINFSTNNSLRMKIDDSGSVNLGDGTQGTLSNILNGKRATSGSESSTLLTLPSSTGVAYTVQAYVVGYGGANGKIGGDVIGVFQNVGGTLTSAGTVIQNKIEDFSGAPDFTLTTSGTDVILQVTGQAATAINWAGHLKFISYDSTL